MNTLIAALAGAIEMAGALVIVWHVLKAARVALSDGALAARAMAASGLVAGLGFKTAATLLKTLELSNWHQIGLFVAVLALRTLIKKTQGAYLAGAAH
jgi:hypothetical protein